MIKLSKIILPILLVAVVLSSCTANNKGAVNVTKYDAKEIEDYGQKVDVNGKKMNIYVTGEGKIPLVIFPGQGEFSARYAYKNMLDILEKSYKLYIVEPLGYGLSDEADTPRTIENITEEIHTALKKLDLDKYYLAAHSLGGMYALNYSKEYPNEVKGFIGIDTSTPNMEGGLETQDQDGAGDWAQTIPDVDNKINEQYFSIGKKIANNDTFKDEAKHLAENLKKMENVKFSKGMPVKYFLASETSEGIKLRKEIFPDLKDWDKQHIDLSEDPKDVSIEELEGDHLLYHTQYERLAKGIADFIEKNESK